MDPDGRLPRGRQPYDAFNGARVGAIVGGLLGGLVTAVTSPALAWVILLGAGIGAAAGYGYERGRIREEQRHRE
jgi:hypothetical protein